MTTMADAQRASFEERLKRIQDGGPNTMGQILVGAPDEATARKKSAKAARKAAETKTSTLSDIALFPIGLLIGALGMLSGRVIAFHFFTPQGRFLIGDPNPYLMLMGDIAVAAILVILMAWAFKLTASALRRLSLFAGMALILFGEPALMEMAPDLFIGLYSDAHVIESTSAGVTGG